MFLRDRNEQAEEWLVKLCFKDMPGGVFNGHSAWRNRVGRALTLSGYQVGCSCASQAALGNSWICP